jgi:hypothetical protein
MLRRSLAGSVLKPRRRIGKIGTEALAARGSEQVDSGFGNAALRRT